MKIEITSKTPGIDFDREAGRLKIWGRSLPENATDFYQPLLDSIDDFKESPIDSFEIEFSFEYFNTSTSRIILDIVKSFAWLEKSGKTKLSATWFYEADDWDMQDAGHEYKQILSDINFELKEVEQFAHRGLPSA